MAFSEFQLGNPGAFAGALEVVGTDISPSMLRNAREACYDEMMVRRGLSEERRGRFFQRSAQGCWEVKPEVRSRVRFMELNLLQSYALLGKFDVVFCRNVLIYFSSDIKRQILTRIGQTMNSGAYLFLGGSESPTGYSDEFEMLRMPQGVLYRKR
jgi:chemotaxis protein methyltransferase CheR